MGEINFCNIALEICHTFQTSHNQKYSRKRVLFDTHSAGIYLFKVNNWNSRTKVWDLFKVNNHDIRPTPMTCSGVFTLVSSGVFTLLTLKKVNIGIVLSLTYWKREYTGTCLFGYTRISLSCYFALSQFKLLIVFTYFNENFIKLPYLFQTFFQET